MRQILNVNFDIYDYITNIIVSYFEKSLEFNELEKEKLYLGIISILINFIKTFFICLIALLIGVLKEVLFMIFVFFCFRLTAGGLHAKRSLTCTITSLIAYIGGATLSIFIPMKYGAFIICILLTIILYKYAPSDTYNRPIIGEQVRRKLKFQTLRTAIIFLILNLVVSNITLLNLTMYAMICQVISILPITYRLLKRSYNNYEKYEK